MTLPFRQLAEWLATLALEAPEPYCYSAADLARYCYERANG